MTQVASTSTLSLTDCGNPAAHQDHPRSAHLFRGRIPEFAQAQWLAVQQAAALPEGGASSSYASQQVHTYAVLQDGRPVVLFFFRLEKRTALVLNEAGQAAGAELDKFSRYLFRHFPAVRRICFHAHQRFIQVKAKKWSAHRSAHRTARLLLPPQPTVRMEEALRFSRHNVAYFLQRLKQDHPDFKLECHANDTATASHCRALLQLNRPQLADARKTESPLDEAGENLVRAAQESGLVLLLKIRGRIAAGAICLQSGGNWQLHFLAQDPRFQAYGLGMLCCYFMACEHADRRRNKTGATLRKLRPTHTLMMQQERIPVLTLRRPHASWLVRCDYALYTTAMSQFRCMVQLRDDCVQLGQALVRLVSAWRLAGQMMKKRLGLLSRFPALPAFLRSH